MSSEQAGTPAPRSISSRIDTTVPHPARRYNYWLGGKDNFAADRQSGDAVAAAFPTIRLSVLENRRFLRRAVSYLATAGIRQFLDIGTGIPSADNTHEVAQSVAPESRVVYVDNDPIVLVHARALLTSSSQGATAYIDADLRQPEKILSDPDVVRTLDFTEPVALMLVSILQFLTDDEDPYGVVATLVAALPPGSYVVISHPTYDFMPPATLEQLTQLMQPRHGVFCPRTRAEFTRFFEGLELIPPGVGPVSDWHAEDGPESRPGPEEIGVYAALGRVPAR